MNSRQPFRPGASRRAGFTLVELLIVLVILGILMAVLFPVFRTVREGGQRTACASNLRQLGMAFLQYVNDHKRYPGSGQYQRWGNGGHWVSGTNDTDGGTAGKLADLTNKEPIPNASSPTGFNTANLEKGALFSYVKEAGVYMCPSNQTGEEKRLTYSMNCALAGISDNRLRTPAQIILLTDEEKANDGMWYVGPSSTDALTAQHNGGGNLLFADGHVKFYSLEDYPVTGSNDLALKQRTEGIPRYLDKAFGPKGFYDSGAAAFGTCESPQ